MSLAVKDLLKYVDLKGLLVEYLLKVVIIPALQEVVAKSENKVDDAVVAVALPIAERALIDIVDAQLKKLLG